MTLQRLIDTLPEILRFGCVGVAATLTHFLILTAAVETLYLDPALANGLAFCIAVFVTYFGQSRWVFRDAATAPRAERAQIGRFAVSLLIGLGANMAIMAIGTRALGLDYRLTFAAGLILVPMASYVINKFWVFGKGFA